jgi:hypothetical protein
MKVMEKDPNKVKKPIFFVIPRTSKMAVGEFSYSQDPGVVKTVIVSPKKKGKGKTEIRKSLSGDEIYDDSEYHRFSLINLITHLMENDFIEKALELINIYFGKITLLEKKLLALNILEATKQYAIPSSMLPEAYYDFMASSDSDDIL